MERECRRRAKDIRDFRGALQGRADKGVLFITTGHFTSQASDEATRDGAISRHRPYCSATEIVYAVCFLVAPDYQLGVETELIESTTVQSDWFEGI